MTPQQLRSTGAATTMAASSHDGWPRGCWLLSYSPDDLGRVPHDTTNGLVSKEHGLELLYATPRMFTPEGIGIGSSIELVRVAYDLRGVQPGDYLTIQAAEGYDYRIQVGRHVTSLALQRHHLGCHR